jgi:hypothetical protein
VRYIREWSTSEEYRQIRQGNYRRVTNDGAVDVASNSSQNEADTLRRQIEELKQEINRIKSQSKNS